VTEKSAFASVLDALERALAQFGSSSGGKIERGFSARGLDSSALTELGELAQRLTTRGREKPAQPLKRRLNPEVHEEKGQVVVLINEPALELKRLQITLAGDMLSLSAEQPNLHFEGEAWLGHLVDDSTRSVSAHAGVIELRWARAPRPRRRTG